MFRFNNWTVSSSPIGWIRPMIESDNVILSDFMFPPYIDLDYMNPLYLWDNLGPNLETNKIIGSVTIAKMIMPGGFTGSLFRIDP